MSCAEGYLAGGDMKKKLFPYLWEKSALVITNVKHLIIPQKPHGNSQTNLFDFKVVLLLLESTKTFS